MALDLDGRAEAVALARRLAPAAGVMKLGLQSFVSHGPGVVREIVASGVDVFLDLKLHDIPNTVAGAAAAAARTGAFLINVHASGGREMMRAGADAARDAAAAAGLRRPLVIAVTVLTSLDAAALGEVGLDGTPAEAAVRLAALTREAGLDGVVCSPNEIAAIRSACGPGFLLVVPGVRPAGSDAGDQRRVATPAAAISAGADILVVGRPITGASDPFAAARAVVDEIAGARDLKRGGAGAPPPREGSA